MGGHLISVFRGLLASLLTLHPSAPQKAFTQAKRLAGVERIGGIHSLRHAYATHVLEQGMPVHQLQRLKLSDSLMGGLVQQAFLRHAPHGEEMLNSYTSLIRP
ncbi:MULTISPECIES: tyrosine-type recombinase/integrase [unclassified Halomonas]|uniref:tyrosine-type recombinase/integrase n=1 Tax=unclassified Halomonas TaxID=2609666 RepID=UPI00246959AC|nr:MULTISPECIES: tyrosine-type recombinase/integrase [unclassified Halomonas]